MLFAQYDNKLDVLLLIARGFSHDVSNIPFGLCVKTYNVTVIVNIHSISASMQFHTHQYIILDANVDSKAKCSSKQAYRVHFTIYP